MTEHESSRTLVKSAPELWAECSDAASLARHLGAFGEIRITRLDPETTVAWEGAAASGTVRLEPSGWGTRVTLTASPAGADGASEPVAGPEPAQRTLESEVRVKGLEEAGGARQVPEHRSGLLQRLLEMFRRRSRSEAPGTPDVDEPTTAQPPPAPPAGVERVLAAALDSLGRAHHRPFSRS